MDLTGSLEYGGGKGFSSSRKKQDPAGEIRHLKEGKKGGSLYCARPRARKRPEEGSSRV